MPDREQEVPIASEHSRVKVEDPNDEQETTIANERISVKVRDYNHNETTFCIKKKPNSIRR